MNDIIHKIKGYLGHRVPIKKEGRKFYYNYQTLDELFDAFDMDFINKMTGNNIKLKLRPLESLTDDELTVIFYLNERNAGTEYPKDITLKYIKNSFDEGSLNLNTLNYLHKHHIDYQDLIGQGLAVEK